VIRSALAPASPPLDPSVDEARAWLARELSDPAYADDRSILQRVLDWVVEHLNRLPEPGGLPSWVLPVVLLVLLGVLVAVLLGTVRRDPAARGRRRAGPVLDEPHLRADDYRARAAAALDAGDPSRAAADWFRALVAASQERTLLDDGPGLTPHEISVALAKVFPTEAGALAEAADLFDRVVYGRAEVDAAAARGMARLDDRLLGTRPALDALDAPGVAP
jgi:hypothetical protein